MNLEVLQLFRNILPPVCHRTQIKSIINNVPYLISATSCLLASNFTFQSLTSTSFVMIWRETFTEVKSKHPWGEARKDLRLSTSSLMRLRTARFSASLMQMESRTWLPVFFTSQPVDMFFSLHWSSYCWEQKDQILRFNLLHFYKLCFIYPIWDI